MSSGSTRPSRRSRPLPRSSRSWSRAGSPASCGSSINDLRIFDLGAFAAEDADRFLDALGTSYGVPLLPPVRARILERIGWPIPYFLQLVFSEISDGYDGTPPTSAAIDAVFERLLHPTRRGYFDYWRQRLHNELDRPTARQAILLLDHIAADPNGATRTTLLQALRQEIPDVDQREEAARFLLRVLEGDGYIVRDQGRYRFRSPLLREFWLRDA